MLDLPAGQTHRALRTLEYTGYVERVPYSKYFQAGPSLHHLIRMSFAAIPLRKAATALLREAASEMQAVVSLDLRLGWKRLRAEIAFGSSEMALEGAQIGAIDPLHLSASGLSILANLPSAEQGAYAEQTSVELDLGLLGKIREVGYFSATTDFDNVQGKLAIPVLDASGNAIAAIGIDDGVNAAKQTTTKTLRRLCDYAAGLEAMVAATPELLSLPGGSDVYSK